MLFDKARGFPGNSGQRFVIAVSRVPKAHLRDLQLPLQLHLGSRQIFGRLSILHSLAPSRAAKVLQMIKVQQLVKRLSKAYTVFLKAHILNSSLKDTRLSFQSGTEHPLG